MYHRYDGGWIEVVCGSMFSGKTEEFIRRLRRAEYAKQKVQVFKPAIDNRYDIQNVSSHAGTKFTAIAIESVEDIRNQLEADTDVVGIDEAQFLGWDIVDLCDELAEQGKRIIVAGLDMDFRGEPFGPMPVLMAQAESVDKLQAICMECGAPASRTQRLVDGEPAHYDAEIIMVGAEEAYQARCRKCHIVPGAPTGHNHT